MKDLLTPLGFWLADRWSDVLDRFADARDRILNKAQNSTARDDSKQRR